MAAYRRGMTGMRDRDGSDVRSRGWGTEVRPRGAGTAARGRGRRGADPVAVTIGVVVVLGFFIVFIAVMSSRRSGPPEQPAAGTPASAARPAQTPAEGPAPAAQPAAPTTVARGEITFPSGALRARSTCGACKAEVVPGIDPCPHCGAKLEWQEVVCGACGGTGKCPKCKGKAGGQYLFGIEREKCGACGGGRVCPVCRNKDGWYRVVGASRRPRQPDPDQPERRSEPDYVPPAPYLQQRMEQEDSGGGTDRSGGSTAPAPPEGAPE